MRSGVGWERQREGMRGAERDIGRMRRSPRLMDLKNIESRVVCQEGNDAVASFFPC